MDLQKLNAVLDEIYFERKRQDEKWGEQNHPNWTSDLSGAFLIGDHEEAKNTCDSSFKRGCGSYAHILLEEFQEAMNEAIMQNNEDLRTELIQVAAVAVAWVEKIDRDLAK